MTAELRPGDAVEVIACQYGTDSEQLLGQRVTITEAFTDLQGVPSWYIEPRLSLIASGDARLGWKFYAAGDAVPVWALPAAWLRRTDPPRETAETWRESVAGTDDMGAYCDARPARDNTQEGPTCPHPPSPSPT